MANEVLQKEGTKLLWADNGTYSPATNNDFGVTPAAARDIDIASVASDGARQSTKSSLGATRARQYAVMKSIEIALDPTAGDTLDIYWSPSPLLTAAVANAGGASGVDAAYSGYAASTLEEGLADMIYIGSLPLAVMNDADGVPQLGFVGVWSPPMEHGSLIEHNKSAQALHSDSVEAATLMTPIVDEVQ